MIKLKGKDEKIVSGNESETSQQRDRFSSTQKLKFGCVALVARSGDKDAAIDLFSAGIRSKKQVI